MTESTNDIKQKAIKGMLWSFIERFGSLLILFVSNIALARMLSPDEFGIVGILMAFVMFSAILVDGGLGNALVQRQTLTKDDCSTVFFTNIAVALVCYASLFFGADWIADFFKQSQLSQLMPVIGLVVIFDAFSAVQNNLLIKEINFRRIAFVKVVAAFLSSAIAVVMAFCGMGVWSLVVQYLVNSVAKSILLWTATTWLPTLTFKWESFKALFGYGSKLLLAYLLSEAYRHAQVLLIGRFFPANQVGLFSQAKHLQDVPNTTILTVVNQVTFPVFSKIQDDLSLLKKGLSRSIKILTFLNFPLMAILIITAEPVFMLLFGEQWIEAAPYFQWLCAGFGLLLVIHNTNLSLLKAIGKSGVVLTLEIVKKIIGVALIIAFFFMGYGVLGILWALAINSVIEFFLNGYFTGKYTGYGIMAQARDLFPALITTAITSAAVWSIPQFLPMHYIAQIFVQAAAFVAIYVLVARVFKLEILQYLLTEVKTRIKR